MGEARNNYANLTGGTLRGDSFSPETTRRSNKFFSKRNMKNVNSFGSTNQRISEYIAIAEVFRSTSALRKLYEKGVLVSNEMQERVQSIVNADEAKNYRSFLPGNAGLSSTAEMLNMPEEAVEETSQIMLGKIQSPKKGTESQLDTEGTRTIDVMASGEPAYPTEQGENFTVKEGTIESELEVEAAVKQAKLEQLRGFQRTMADVEEQYAEERVARLRMAEMGYEGVTSEEDERRIEMRANRVKEIMRKNFESMLEENDEGEGLPAPSNIFSITSMNTCLELLTKSIATLVDATDEICVTTTFKTDGEPVTLFPCTRALQTHSAYSKEVHETVVNHLKHFQCGEKAILEGGTEEVNNLRRRFLLCKDQLIAEEQKLSASEEHLEALLKRLINLHQRCDMWETSIFGREIEPEVSEENDPPRDWEVPQLDDVLCAAPLSIVPASPSALSPVSTVDMSLQRFQEAVNAASSSQLSPSLSNPSNKPSPDLQLKLEDDCEAYVATSWGNPYVVKARKREQALFNSAMQNMSSKNDCVSPRFHLNSTISDLSPSFQNSVSLKAGRSWGMSVLLNESEEVQRTAHARRLALLQSLLRSLPSINFVPKELPEANTSRILNLSFFENEPESENKELTETSKEAEEKRRATRQSIQALIRHTTQQLEELDLEKRRNER